MKDKERATVCFVASGSGGHIIPALVLARQYYEKTGARALFFTSTKSLDRSLLSSQQFFDVVTLPLQKLPGNNLFAYPKFFLDLLASFYKSFSTLIFRRPSTIKTTGGHLSIPVCIAGWLLRVPIEIYELNAIPGKANKFIAPISSKIFVVFENCKKFFKESRLVPYPLRFSIVDRQLSKEKAIELINQIYGQKFESNKKIIFVLGGSQGSTFLDSLFVEWVKKNAQLWNKLQIVHQTPDFKSLESFYSSLQITAISFKYSDDIKLFYIASEIVISRAGAGALFEEKFFNKKTILIPLQTRSTDHQLANAEAMALDRPDLFVVIKQRWRAKALKELGLIFKSHFP